MKGYLHQLLIMVFLGLSFSSQSQDFKIISEEVNAGKVKVYLDQPYSKPCEVPKNTGMNYLPVSTKYGGFTILMTGAWRVNKNYDKKYNALQLMVHDGRDNSLKVYIDPKSDFKKIKTQSEFSALTIEETIAFLPNGIQASKLLERGISTIDNRDVYFLKFKYESLNSQSIYYTLYLRNEDKATYLILLSTYQSYQEITKSCFDAMIQTFRFNANL